MLEVHDKMVGMQRIQSVLLIVLLLSALVVSKDACKCKRKQWDFNAKKSDEELAANHRGIKTNGYATAATAQRRTSLAPAAAAKKQAVNAGLPASSTSSSKPHIAATAIAANEIASDTANTEGAWCLAGVAAGGAASVLVVPYALAAAGFGSAGVAAGSLAAWTMSWFGGTVPAWIAALQSAGAAGLGYGGGATVATLGGSTTLLAAAETLGCVKTVCCRCDADPDCHCDSAPT